ncbi:MAG: bifunctional nicotinamidase/pyrazinamidase [Rhodopila sp.]
MQINPATDILGLVDIQPTFMPGGELAVARGDEIVPVVNRLLTRFDHAFMTQDWHPPGHVSFASAHPGRQPYDTIDLPYGRQVLWPDHGVAGTPTAAIHSAVDQTRVEVIIRKGFHPALDSYSAFFENDRATPTGLEGWLRQRGFSRLFLCGLATDFCVAWSAEDAARLGFTVVMIEDACRGIGLPTTEGRTTIDEVRDRLTALGVTFIDSTGLQNAA